jgi:tetratricopeptide (TPR) repeat protein
MKKCNPTILALAVSFALTVNLTESSLALSSQEEQTLNSWKLTASSSALGQVLLSVLSDCNHKLAINSLNGEAYFKRGYLYGVVGCTNSALNDLSRAIEISPYDSRFYTERALCYIDLKSYDNALIDLNKAIALKPANGNALLARGRLWLLTGKALMAIGDLRCCQNADVQFKSELPGEYAANHYNAPAYYLGQCYETLGRNPEALFYYKEALKAGQGGSVGYLHRWADQPIDTKYRVTILQQEGGQP